MHKSLISLSAIFWSFASISVLSQAPGIGTPEMSVQARADTEARVMADGRIVHRYSAATVGLVYVEWPEGATTTAHNHTNELVLTVVSGRLRAMSGDK